MAGKWEQTNTPGVYVQQGRNGKPRYKAAFRDARGVVTSRTFPRERMAKDYLADIRIRRATNTLPDVSKGARTMTDLWEHFQKTYRGKPSTFASYAHRWRNHIQPAFGKSRLDSLRRSTIEEFYEALAAVACPASSTIGECPRWLGYGPGFKSRAFGSRTPNP